MYLIGTWNLGNLQSLKACENFAWKSFQVKKFIVGELDKKSPTKRLSFYQPLQIFKLVRKTT